MSDRTTLNPTDVIRAELLPVTDGVPDDAVLFDLVGDAHLVLLGEASHGTRDFYDARARMTRRLVEERGFTAVAVEADWPDAYRVNRYVRGEGADADAEEALRGFERFPSWMWRNATVVDFVGWLRGHNDRAAHRGNQAAGFYGLDLYSLRRSMQEVVAYLELADPEAAVRARERYSCFDRVGTGDDLGQSYGLGAAFGAGESCERDVVEQLVELQRHAVERVRSGGMAAADEAFYAVQNAQVVRDAERYYRTMFTGQVPSWNLRDNHMVESLEALLDHLSRQQGAPARVVVWEHNSHLGDARATEMSRRGELNVGQLVRERHPGDCWSLGFTTYTGTVTASDDWGGQADRKWVRPALRDSVEDLFHQVDEPEFMVPFARAPESAELLRRERLERAIGVIYRPDTERQSHYFWSSVAQQFDATIHIDESWAVEPLERTSRWEAGEVPETYPFTV
ncbi:MAG: Erythromycin esterase [Acidimicrobiales bacterium]|nr:Erythromycin esterase [Acidimicrobiales bacterium]